MNREAAPAAAEAHQLQPSFENAGKRRARVDRVDARSAAENVPVAVRERHQVAGRKRHALPPPARPRPCPR